MPGSCYCCQGSGNSRGFDDDLAIVSVCGIKISRAEVHTERRVFLKSPNHVLRKFGQAALVGDRKWFRRKVPPQVFVSGLSLGAEPQNED